MHAQVSADATMTMSAVAIDCCPSVGAMYG
jgi:hypothetical protein